MRRKICVVLLLFAMVGLAVVSTATPAVASTLSTDTGWANPTSTATVPIFNNGFTDPEYAYTSNDSYAQAVGPDVQLMQEYYGFGFDIPSSATIDGIQVCLEGYYNPVGSSFNVFLIYNGAGGSAAPQVKFAYFSPTEGNVYVGGDDQTWGRTWSASDLTDSNFRVRLRKPDFQGGTIYLDNVRVIVHYTVQLFDVTVEAEGNGDTLSVPITGTYDSTNASGTTTYLIEDIIDGSSMTLTAPATHTQGYAFYVFDQWQVSGGSPSAIDQSVTFTVNDDITATAYYTKVINVDKTLEECYLDGPVPVDRNEVPIGTKVNFEMTITVHAWETVTDVMVEDGIGADLVVDEVGGYTIPVLNTWETYRNWRKHTASADLELVKKGKADKMGATKIYWDLHDPNKCVDYELDILVYTGENAQGKQEYTSPDEHELNSGPEVYFTYDGIIYMLQGPPVPVTVVVDD